MPHEIDVTSIFYEPVILLFKDASGLFTVRGWRCRQCGFETANKLFHGCTAYLN